MQDSLLQNQSNLNFYHGVFRINSDVSSGCQSLELIAKYAKNAGVDFIVVSDQFLVHVEYGLLPFRQTIKHSQDQQSVVSYGIEKYLQRVAKVDQDNPELTVIPGVDIAPHYFWTGSPLNGSLTANQFSQQLTIFGTNEIEFYKNLPVIHNNQTGAFFPGTLIALLPLLLTLAGLSMFFRKAVSYKDHIGNTYSVPMRKYFKIVAGFLIILGLVWAWNNQPFSKSPPFNQYTNAGDSPYQYVFNYIRKAEKKLKQKHKIGVIWASPEATMREQRMYASLQTVPFISDIQYTYKHNGFAGIYGDVSTAHLQNSFWDDMIKSYCDGKRETPSVIVGERDWHGRGNLPIDFIKTVTVFRSCKTGNTKSSPDAGEIVRAITAGQSYAVVQPQNRELKLSDVRIEVPENHSSFAIPGETLQLNGSKEVIFRLAGSLTGDAVSSEVKGRVIIIVDGQQRLIKNITLNNFNISEKIKVDTVNGEKHYIRFYILQHSTPIVVCNPIYML